MGIQLKHLLARWALAELREAGTAAQLPQDASLVFHVRQEQISSCNDFNIDMETSAKIHLRGLLGSFYSFILLSKSLVSFGCVASVLQETQEGCSINGAGHGHELHHTSSGDATHEW